ncbi:fimbrial biogenesis chaperone [Pseudomonas saponiphila]
MFLGLFSGTAHAGIVLQGTRLVYPADAREVTLKISNSGPVPLLAQSWIDKGEANKAPEEIQVPFLLAPAVSRLESGDSAVLRLAYSKEPLATDRESLFWLNVLETPPRKEKDENVLQFAFRTRIKIFFRPHNLDGAVDSAAEKTQVGVQSRRSLEFNSNRYASACGQGIQSNALLRVFRSYRR